MLGRVMVSHKAEGTLCVCVYYITIYICVCVYVHIDFCLLMHLCVYVFDVCAYIYIWAGAYEFEFRVIYSVYAIYMKCRIHFQGGTFRVQWLGVQDRSRVHFRSLRI